MDTDGRIITFDVGNSTFANVYPMSGTDGDSRNSRESLISSTLTNILINKKNNGIIGGDWNCVILKTDCTKNFKSKISPSLKRLVFVLNLKDSHKSVSKDSSFSRYYSSQKFGQDVTRIDRLYYYSGVYTIKSEYKATAFSDHWLKLLLTILQKRINAVRVQK